MRSLSQKFYWTLFACQSLTWVVPAMAADRYAPLLDLEQGCVDNSIPALPPGLYDKVAESTDPANPSRSYSLPRGRYRIDKPVSVTNPGFSLEGNGSVLYWYANPDILPLNPGQKPPSSNIPFQVKSPTDFQSVRTAIESVARVTDPLSPSPYPAFRITPRSPFPRYPIGGGEALYLECRYADTTPGSKCTGPGKQIGTLFVSEAGANDFVARFSDLPGWPNEPMANLVLARRRDLLHAWGQIGPDTDSLILRQAVPSDLQPGEVVRIKYGVNVTDPSDAVDYVERVVRRISGQTISFTEPFRTTVPTYGCYRKQDCANSVEAALLVPESTLLKGKLGDWGIYQGIYPGKGKGLDHGIQRLKPTNRIRPADFNLNAAFQNFTLVTCMDWPKSGPLNAGRVPPNGNHFGIYNANHVTVKNVNFVNAVGTMFRLQWADNFRAENIVVRGHGIGRLQGTDLVAAGITGLYGGKNNTFKNFDVKGTNFAVTYTELNPTNLTYENMILDVSQERLTRVVGVGINRFSWPLFAFWGDHFDGPNLKGVTIVNNAGGVLFMGGQRTPAKFTDLRLLAKDYEHGLSAIDIAANQFKGVTTIQNRRFLPERNISMGGYVLPPAIGDTTTVEFPEALYGVVSMAIQAPDVTHVAAVTRHSGFPPFMANVHRWQSYSGLGGNVILSDETIFNGNNAQGEATYVQDRRAWRLQVSSVEDDRESKKLVFKFRRDSAGRLQPIWVNFQIQYQPRYGYLPVFKNLKKLNTPSSGDAHDGM